MRTSRSLVLAMALMASAGALAARQPGAAAVAPPALDGCDIEGQGEPTPAACTRVEVFAGASGSERLASQYILTGSASLRTRWRLGASLALRAPVELSGPAVHVKGWASVADRIFQLRRRIEVMPGRLWLPAGTFVTLRRSTPAGVLVAVQVPFSAPSRLEVTVPCSALAYQGQLIPSDSEPARGSSYALLEARQPYDLLDGPAGKRVLRFEATPSTRAIAWLEERDGHVHIAGGGQVQGGRELAFDGWIARRHLRRGPRPVLDRDHSSCLDKQDRCLLGGTVGRDTPLRVGVAPPGRVAGTLRAGATVHPLQLSGADLAIELPGEELQPPPGARFWVKADDLRLPCTLHDLLPTGGRLQCRGLRPPCDR